MTPSDRPADPSLLAPLRLVTGDEELLISRAVTDVVRAARAADPETDVRRSPAVGAEIGELMGLLSPSLFGERRVVVIEAVQDARADLVAALLGYIDDPIESTCLVITHTGGGPARGASARSVASAKAPPAGKSRAMPNRRTALFDAMRAAGAPEVVCDRLTRPEERVDFVRAEVRRAGGSISATAAALLLDAVGSDLRELAAACEQLVLDSAGDDPLDAGSTPETGAHAGVAGPAGTIDTAAVRRYYRGRAEVSGFAVADRAVVGDVAGALETLRWALSVGVAHVLIADALAEGVRSVARVAGAGGGNPYALAGGLGMPPWKVKRAQAQSRGWTQPGLVRALVAVADVNAGVKGAAADPSYALEKAVRAIATARGAG